MKQRNYVILFLLVLSETLCYSYSLCRPVDFTQLPISFYSVAYFVLGVLIAVFPTVIFPARENPFFDKRMMWIYAAVFLLLSNWMFNEFRLYLHLHPLDIGHLGSDMLLYIDVMAARFLSSAPLIYEKVSSVWGVPFDAVYFPAMWLPFSVPVFFGFDLRWATFFAVILAVFAAFLYAYKKRLSLQHFTIAASATALLIYELLKHGGRYFSTEEGVVFLYYTLLCFAFLMSGWKWAGVALALCLFSRFPVVLMLPAALVLLFREHKNAIYTTAFYCVLTLAALLLLSGTYDEIGAIAAIPFKYHKMLTEMDDRAFSGAQWSVSHSLGLAKFWFNKKTSMLEFAAPATLLLSLVFAVLLQKTKSRLPIGFQLLCLLKLTLVIFFNTLLVSHDYLLYTSSIVSVFILIADLGELRVENGE